MSDGGDAATRKTQQTLVQITRCDIFMKFEGGHEVRLNKLLMALSVSSTPLPELHSLTSKELGPAYPTVCIRLRVLSRRSSPHAISHSHQAATCVHDRDMDSLSTAVFPVT
jgi:hypothetical protein